MHSGRSQVTETGTDISQVYMIATETLLHQSQCVFHSVYFVTHVTQSSYVHESLSDVM